MKKLYLLLIVVLLLCGCNQKVKIEKHNMFYMDTYIEVKLYDTDNSNIIFDEIDDIYKKYHQLADRYSKYDKLINIYYLNNILKENEEITIDKDLSDLINYGINMYDNTDGYINIALGNVIDVWKSYREKETGVPTYDELSNSGSIDINDIVLKDNKYLKKSNVKLDLGAYAKGYATEKVGEYLEQNGYNKYLINAGGNVKVGSKYKDEKYKIGIEEPFNTDNIYKTLNVEDVSIVTSGNYQRYYLYNNINYNHIINPKTLFPENNTKSVTIITKDSAYADILSTYMFLLPIDKGIEIINNIDGVEAIWNNDKIYYSKGFNKYE